MLLSIDYVLVVVVIVIVKNYKNSISITIYHDYDDISLHLISIIVRYVS